MSTTKSGSVFAQLQREMQEYRASLIWTPVVVGGALVFAILLSILLANRLAFLGEGALEVLINEQSGGGGGLNITISIDDDVDTEQLQSQDIVVIEEQEGEAVDDEWNFSKEWTFRPPQRQQSDTPLDEDIETLNPAFSMVHVLFQMILAIVSVNYLLGCLYDDRKDRSILFWKSMPVSEWQEVLCKLGVASLLAPLAYLAVSIVTQLFVAVLAMLMVWRLDAGSPGVVLDNIQFIDLFGGQIGAFFIWALWTVPIYAWFLLASAAAKRSPFLLAFGIPIGLCLVERIFFGSNILLSFIAAHVPTLRESDADSMGLYMHGPVWASLDYLAMLFGLVVGAVLLTGAVWLRKHRFEI